MHANGRLTGILANYICSAKQHQGITTCSVLLYVAAIAWPVVCAAWPSPLSDNYVFTPQLPREYRTVLRRTAGSHGLPYYETGLVSPILTRKNSFGTERIPWKNKLTLVALHFGFQGQSLDHTSLANLGASWDFPQWGMTRFHSIGRLVAFEPVT